MNKLLICGPQRSGTTIIEEIINSHPNFYITHELDWLHVLKQVNGALFHPRHTGRKVLPFKGRYDEIIEILYRSSSPKKLSWIGDKLPDYFINFLLLNISFDNVKFIFCFRNPIDIVNSMLERNNNALIGIDRGWEAKISIKEICNYINLSYNKYIEFSSMVEANILLVSYEELIKNPKKITENISSFLGVTNLFDTSRIFENKPSRIHITSSIEKQILKYIDLKYKFYDETF